jgi:beta-mannosidase
MLTTTPLAAWTLTAASTVPVALPDGGLAVTVPGCVHTDLMAAGLIPDPYLDLNETLTAWVSQADWTSGHAGDRGSHADVVFEGPTPCRSVPRRPAARLVTDIHRTWRFPLGPRRRASCRCARNKARAYAALAKGLASGYPQPFNAIRSMACSFGWDWGPMTITSGIWRPARVETWSTARLDEVRAAVSLVGGDGVLDIVAAAVGDLTGLDVVASCDGVTVTAAPGPLQLVVPRPAVWWPVGFGEQPLSDVTVELRRGDVVLDQRALRVGFRTVQWHRDPDAEGTLWCAA